MAVTSYTHSEGEHWIIETGNKEWTGNRLGVPFTNGIGRTTFVEKAQEFDEVWNFTVVPYPDAPAWENVSLPVVETGKAWRTEKPPVVLNELPVEAVIPAKAKRNAA